MTPLKGQVPELEPMIAWTPIKETEWIPPLGDALRLHLKTYHGAVRHASCSAWGLLYRLLEENEIPFGTVVFDKNGKPRFSDIPLYFSLSHSKGVCAAAVCSRAIGVDIEQCKSDYRPQLVERSFTEKERTSFDGDFTRL